MVDLAGGICYTLRSGLWILTFFGGLKMKLTRVNLDQMAENITRDLLCMAGLKNAKKIVAQVKRNLAAEFKRRKTYENETN